MSAFDKSAAYYDDFYKTKNYEDEVTYVEGLLRRVAPGVRSVLDLGCGTGRHAVQFAKKGYTVVGVDRSSGMLKKAVGRLGELPFENRELLSFCESDVRELRMTRLFDAAVSLFHVASYQTTNADFLKLLKTANSHIQTGGVLIFDCWYGPAVLADPPVVRVARSDTGNRRVIRIAEPKWRSTENLVDINYSFIVLDHESRLCLEFQETHSMRYYFAPELDLALETVGFERVLIERWMTGEEPDERSWSISVVARKASSVPR